MTNPDHSPRPMNDVLSELDGMLQACASTSRRTQAVVAIIFCINEGITFGQQIIGVLRRKGFSPRHIDTLLHDLSGDTTACPIWHRDAEGHYRNLRAR